MIRMYCIQMLRGAQGGPWPPVIRVRGEEHENVNRIMVIKRDGAEVARIPRVLAWWIEDEVDRR